MTTKSPITPSRFQRGVQLSRPHEIALIAVLCSTQLITQLHLLSVLIPLQIIGKDFNNNTIGERSWFCASYSLTVGTFVLIAGQLGDIYGHKRMLLGGWLWTGIWSAVAGFSVYTRSTIFFDVCRALQGIGPAFLLPNSLALFGHVYPSGRRKEMVFALFASMAPTGGTIGGILGSVFAVLAWWPWSFWSTAIWCLFMTGIVYFVIPELHKSPENDAARVFDWIGACLGVSGLVLINFAWNQAVVVGWEAPYTYALLLVGLLAMVVFCFHELHATNPLVPMNIWSGKVSCTIICLALSWSSFGTWIFYVFQLITVERGVNTILASAQFVSEMISGITAAIVTGYLLSRVPTTWLMTASTVAFLVGCLLAATAPVHQTYWANIFTSMIIMAWGMDMSFPATTLILSDMVPRESQGIAASLVNTVVNYSISIGLGISGTVDFYTNDQGRDTQRGLYLALWTSVALASLALVISLAFTCWVRYTGTKMQ